MDVSQFTKSAFGQTAPQGSVLADTCSSCSIATASAPPRRSLALGVPLSYGWLLGPTLLTLVWVIGSSVGLIDHRILPAPLDTMRTALELIGQGRLQTDLAVSALRTLQGLFYGVVLGVLVALVSGLTLTGGYLFDSLIQMKRAIPTLALLPLLILWFGIGEAMKVVVIALSVFLQVYVHAHNALRTIDLKHVELAESLRLSRYEFLRHVVLPGALPGFLLGLRFAVAAAWLALVVVEQVNATSGIGYMITLARTYAQTDIILVGLVVYALLGLTSDASVRLLERRLLTWRRTLAA
jgi:sulfonate transport system permease protein